MDVLPALLAPLQELGLSIVVGVVLGIQSWTHPVGVQIGGTLTQRIDLSIQ